MDYKIPPVLLLLVPSAVTGWFWFASSPDNFSKFNQQRGRLTDEGTFSSILKFPEAHEDKTKTCLFQVLQTRRGVIWNKLLDHHLQ